MTVCLRVQCEDAAAICVVFDVSKEQSFENCAIWAEEIRSRSGREHVRGTRSHRHHCIYLPHGSHGCATVCAGALVANKTDLEDRVFGNARMRGQQFAQGYGLQYFETSAVRAEPGVISPAFRVCFGG